MGCDLSIYTPHSSTGLLVSGGQGLVLFIHLYLPGPQHTAPRTYALKKAMNNTRRPL